MAEKRSFKMHPNLLLDVIRRQAGTLQKAVLEGVMNSIEAGATRVEVLVEPRKIVIRDDGKGFQNRDEVERFFEIFGLPHDASENKRWAEFRMGRGQIFAFGKNVWQTGQFVMRVDIKANGSDYDLEDCVFPPFAGCRVEVELYDVLNDRDIYGVTTEAARQVRYVSIPVLINGKQVNTPPENEGEKWNRKESDENAYVRLNGSAESLAIYNLGIFVVDIPKYRHGVAGVVVSKKRLEVNFARNEIIKSCPVWQAIQKKIEKSAAVKKVKTKRVLNEDERFNMIGRLCAGGLDQREAAQAQLFLDVQGHAWSVNRIMKAEFPCWTYAKRGDHVGESLLHRRLALVLDEENVNLFTATNPQEIFTHEWSFTDEAGNRYAAKFGWWRDMLKYVPFKELASNVDSRDDILPLEKWRQSEKIWQRVIGVMAERIRLPDGGDSRRKIVIGTSNRDDAWTDGETFISFARSYLEKLPLMKYDRPVVRSLVDVAQTLFHEMCHADLEKERDEEAPAWHPPEFYKTYHDVTGGWADNPGLPEIVAVACSYLSPARYADLVRQARGEPETASGLTLAAKGMAEARGLLEEEVAALPPGGVAVAESGGRTAKEVTSNAEIDRIWKAYKGNGGTLSYEGIELDASFNLRHANGMTAHRIIKKRREAEAAGKYVAIKDHL